MQTALNPPQLCWQPPRRQKLLEHIWQRTSLSHQQFDTLYLAPLHRYAELVQQFPASESHHHAYPGGMLDHGLEIVAYALKLRQSHLLPAGAAPEDQAAQSEVWTAAVVYAALLHDIDKIAVDIQVELIDGSTWHPWHGMLQQTYRFRYREGRAYRLHSAATGLLTHHLLTRDILDWLSGYPDLWASLLYVLAGHYEHAGTLGEFVTQADRALAAPKTALQRKLLDGLRTLFKHELKLNQPQGAARTPIPPTAHARFLRQAKRAGVSDGSPNGANPQRGVDAPARQRDRLGMAGDAQIENLNAGFTCTKELTNLDQSLYFTTY